MKQPPLHNYVVGFFDLLGQRKALEGQGPRLPFASPDDEQVFVKSVRDSIGAIIELHRRAEDFLGGALKHRRSSPRRMALPKNKRKTWDALYRTRLTTQRWSDGLMNFICLGDTTVKCPTSAIFNLVGLAGSLCYLGLAAGRPIRGAIDIAWGVELHKGELYGAAVARAYELESGCAKYPRIVVGPEAVKYLQLHTQSPGADDISVANREFATLSLSLLAQDDDETWFVNYLGTAFRDAITSSFQSELYPKARAFVDAQLLLHTQNNDVKLTDYYQSLVSYFNANPFES